MTVDGLPIIDWVGLFRNVTVTGYSMLGMTISLPRRRGDRRDDHDGRAACAARASSAATASRRGSSGSRPLTHCLTPGGSSTRPPSTDHDAGDPVRLDVDEVVDPERDVLGLPHPSQRDERASTRMRSGDLRGEVEVRRTGPDVACDPVWRELWPPCSSSCARARPCEPVERLLRPVHRRGRDETRTTTAWATRRSAGSAAWTRKYGARGSSPSPRRSRPR